MPLGSDSIAECHEFHERHIETPPVERDKCGITILLLNAAPEQICHLGRTELRLIQRYNISDSEIAAHLRDTDAQGILKCNGNECRST